MGNAGFKVVTTIYNGSAPGANTGIINAIDGAAVSPERRALWRVTVALTTSSVFNVTATDGTTPHKWGLNASSALNAADLYTFTFGVDPNLTYDFEVETDSVIEQLLVEELYTAVV